MAATVTGAVNVPQVNRVSIDAPWKWLAQGYRDMLRAPSVSLAYGAIFTAISLLVLLVLAYSGAVSLVLPLAGGYLLIAPLIAVGLYETSRRLSEGEKVTFSDAISFSVRSPGQLAFMGVFLLIIYFIWLDLAFLLFMLFHGPSAFRLENLTLDLLLTTGGVVMLVIGTIAGGMLALLVFSISAISIPMLMRRKVDAVTAALTSMRAVVLNPYPMLLWAVLIAGMMAFAFATLFIGMVVIFPLIGHATWHAYRELVPPLEAPKAGGEKGKSGTAGRATASKATD
ncbi:MAG: DUF2189 domain-containing protein [Methyloligellaceae bacterium]